MRRSSPFVTFGFVACVAMLGPAACDRPPAPAETPAPQVPPPAAPAAETNPGASPAAMVTPPAEVQPAAVPSPATVVASGHTSAVPDISSMELAEPPHKLGAPVDLRYQFEGDLRADQPVTLHLAAVPRVAGSKLTMSVKKQAGIDIAAPELTVQKAGASTPYRQELSVTKATGGPAEVRVLVMMETQEGSTHSWFSIPLGTPAAAGKRQPDKLE